MQAILYVGHGSRVQAGNEQFQTFINRLKPVFEAFQTHAFIELTAPTIQEGIDRCVQAGATKIAVVPVLLLTAFHANKDIPNELKEAQKRYPSLQLTYGRPFGIHDDVIQVAIDRLKAAGLQEWDHDREEGTTILLIGRGSSDGNQPSDVAKIGRLLYERMACDNVEIAFLAATTPTVEQGLKKCERLGAKKVYVLPYLLFTGVLMNELSQSIQEREKDTETNYILCDFLGFDFGLEAVLEARVKETLTMDVMKR
ncbi:sirohydrochlorin chelatase [Alkalihalobacillus sp. LMS6]|uniref:sirohydrochlorin chelatase n=1 Tax=Alkalihalobacillus sp. LMS6 TaxID=2924034 RepID=UPI0020D1B864|nr:sirohydrochlorin chelatase [Alkalihalobacillus sp. LMS6]UTR07271.1 sirohydrochlorin chelatase [Alkalihalobacillus sp. LMS6]